MEFTILGNLKIRGDMVKENRYGLKDISMKGFG